MKFAVNASIMFIFQKEAGKRRKRNKPIISITQICLLSFCFWVLRPPLVSHFGTKNIGILWYTYSLSRGKKPEEYLQNAVLWFITFWESSWDVRCIVCTLEMGFVLLIQGYDKHGIR